MAKLKIKFLGGESALNGMATALFGIQFRNFIIGDSAGFEPTGNETSAQGAVTFIGGHEDIKVKLFDQDRSARISMLLAGNHDNVVIGNVVLFAHTSQGVKPMLIMALPEKVYKQNTASDILAQGFPYPETRLILSVTIKYINANEIETSYTVDIITPEVANLPFFGSDEELPIGSANPWAQFIVNSSAFVGGVPALVTKDADDNYFSSPLFQNLASPKYGILDGGYRQGQDRDVWIWGMRFVTPTVSFNGIYGGVGFDSPNIDNLPVLGGSSF